MSFRVALTGLNAATADLGVIANNIANSNTTGFKSSRAEFADLFASSAQGVTSNTVGSGVQLAAVAQQFEQGTISFTGNPLDLALNGQGFFRLSDNGTVVYSRAGAFGVDRTGFVVNSAGQRLTGFQAGPFGNVANTLTDLRITTTDLLPSATTAVDATLNLDAQSPEPVITPFDPTEPSSFNYSTSISIFDSLGVAHDMTMYFVKTPTANGWEVHATVDGTAEGNVTLSDNAVVFKSDGTIDTDATTQPIDVSVDLDAIATELGITNGATTPLDFTLDFSDATQFGSPFSTNALTQDGFTSGRLAGVDIDDSGIMFGRYSNGQSLVMGQVALANFRNVQGLTQLGDNVWVESFASGPPLVGAPGTGSLGMIQSGALEDSNVELTEQLVNMINAQRTFQANAQVITTSDTLTQTILNIR